MSQRTTDPLSNFGMGWGDSSSSDADEWDPRSPRGSAGGTRVHSPRRPRTRSDARSHNAGATFPRSPRREACERRYGAENAGTYRPGTVSNDVERRLNEDYLRQMSDEVRPLDGIIIGAGDTGESESFQRYLRVASALQDTGHADEVPPCSVVENAAAAEAELRRAEAVRASDCHADGATKEATPARESHVPREPEPEPEPER